MVKYLTVAELIEKLQAMPKDHLVLLEDANGRLNNVARGVEVYKRKDWEGLEGPFIVIG